MKYIFIILLLNIIFSEVYAGSVTNVQKLTFFRTGHQDDILVVVGGLGGFVSSEGCKSSRAALKKSTVNSKEMFSHLMSAYLANKEVKFYGNGCVAADSTEYINIQYIYFE